MTTTTMSRSHAGYAEKNVRSGRGFFRRLLDSIMAAREAEARRHIARALRSYSDRDLMELGFTREELADWHAPRD